MAKRRRGQKLLPEEERKIVALAHQGLSMSEIGRRVGCTNQTVATSLKRQGHGKPDERRGRKPDAARRAKMLKLRSRGLSLAEIGERLGVTRQCVQITLAKVHYSGAEGEE